MNQVYKGKTKDVFALDNGNYMLQFKDDVTGENGQFDPGANTVGLSIGGIGREWLRLTQYFFLMLKESGVKTHFIGADIDKSTMEVLPATVFGKGVECICRFRSTGSFMRRYGAYAQEGQELDGIVEITLKDDERGDPVITQDIAQALGVMDRPAFEKVTKMTRDISVMIRDDLLKKGIVLYDIKLEFGLSGDEVILIDEISGGNMRVYKDGKLLEPLQIVKEVLGE